MKKILNWMLAAIFICGSSVFASCVANEDNSSADVPGGEVTEPYVEPTDDQLEVKVTADMPTAVLAQFDESTVAAALIKRLTKTTTAIDDNTKLVLLDDSQIKSLTEDDYFAMARVIFNGGYVALHRPKFENAFFFAVSLNDQFDDVVDKVLEDNGVAEADDEGGEEAGGGAAASSSRNDGEMVRKVNNAFAMTNRAAEVDANTVIDELIVFSINANYMIPPYSEEMTSESRSEDEQGQETTVEQKVKHLLNPYHCGQLADGVATWLNAKEQEKADAQQPEAASAKHRAEANEVINSMMSCTDEFTISGSLNARDDQGRQYNRKNLSNTTIRSWSVHDFASNRDFYYVEESHHIRMGGENSDKSKTLYWGPYNREDWMYTTEEKPLGGGIVWWPKTFSVEGYEGYGSDYAFYYGSWLDESRHTMKLTGAGEIKVEKSLPSTDNNQSTETIAIGTTDGTSHTSGWSFGGSLGGNAGMSGSNGTGGGSGGFNFSYTNTNTTSHSTSFTMSTSQVSKDLAITRNTDGAAVTWHYKQGHKPEIIFQGKFWHELAAPILTNDIDITNKVCWSVENPSGQYKLYWYRKNWTQAKFAKANRELSTDFSMGCGYDKTHTLSAPRRFKKEWYCDLRVSGKNLNGDARDKFLAYLREVVNPTMFSNKFNLAEATNDGVKVIKYNVGVATKILKKNSQLRDMIEYRAKELGIEKYTIKWFTNDEAVNKKHKPFTFPREIGKN